MLVDDECPEEEDDHYRDADELLAVGFRGLVILNVKFVVHILGLVFVSTF
jgi:hypothetical protein